MAMMPVADLAQLLDSAVQVAEHRVEVDHALAIYLEDNAEHAMGRGMLRAEIDQHLAVAQVVELGLALGPRRIRRDGVEDGRGLLDEDVGIVE